MKKIYILKILLGFVLLCSFTLLKNGNFSIKAHITGFEEDTPIFLIDAETSSVLDTTYVKNNRFEFLGKTTKEPKNFVLYIPLQNGVKYTYLFIADEDITVEGTIDDFPKKLMVKGSVHHVLSAEYDKITVEYDEKISEKRNKMLNMQKQNRWNDSLQRAYLGKKGVLTELDNQRTEAEKRFIAENTNTFYGLQVLYYKRTKYTDNELKKMFSKFNKELQKTKNGKGIQAYIDNPEIKKGKKYADFEALDRNGNTKKLSDMFDGKRYVLVDFSSPTCQFSKKSVPMLQYLNKTYSDKLKLVTFYTEDKKEHFDYFSNTETSPWEFLWTEQGNEGFPYVHYRINSTPTYYLFAPSGKLIEKWSGFQEGYYDATQTKIEKMVGVK